MPSSAARADPTRTGDLRRRFAADLRRRWQCVATVTRDALVTKNLFALAGPTPEFLQHQQSGSIEMFQSFFDNAILHELTGDNRGWISAHVIGAYERGVTRVGDGLLSWSGGRLFLDAAFVELQGLCEAVSQQVVRAFADGVLRRRKPNEVMRTITERIRKVGVERSVMLADFSVVRAYNEGQLDAMEQLGVTRVGIIPEHVHVPMTVDAPTRASRERLRAKRQANRLNSANMVNIATAGDDKVCPTCEDLEEEGPYDIQQARGLIPAHPRCRCAFVPLREEIVLDAWDPDKHPRHPAGSSKGGEFASTGGIELSHYAPNWEALPKDRVADVRRSVKRWADMHYDLINTALRDLAEDDDILLKKVSAKIDRDVKNLDELFDKTARELKRPIKVYRGIDADLGLSVGDEYIDYGFHSTSIDKDVAMTFTGGASLREKFGGKRRPRTLFEIEVPKGTKVVAPNLEIDPNSGIFEAELLLKRKTRFKVIEVLPNGFVRVRVMR